MRDPAHLQTIFTAYRQHGFGVALDDFGTGFSSLAPLADLLPDAITLDRSLIRDVHANRARATIVGGLVRICHELGIGIAAEGIEAREEAQCLLDLGIHLFQGYLFARAGFERCPPSPSEPLVTPEQTGNRRAAPAFAPA